MNIHIRHVRESKDNAINIDVSKVIEILESIGYRHRVSECWVIGENDGYINVSVNKLSIQFHKNFYETNSIDFLERYKGKTNLYGYSLDYTISSDITITFTKFNEFLDFMNKHHIDKFRNLKLDDILNDDL